MSETLNVENITETPEDSGNENTMEDLGNESQTEESGDEDAVFDRDYVRSLRDENKRYRLKAKTADELATRLHEQLVKADGRLQDHTDLPFDPEHLDGEKLTEAIDELLERKPHLRSRRVSEDIGAGNRGDAGSVSSDLIGLIRNIT